VSAASHRAAFDQLVKEVQGCRACPRMEGRRRVLGHGNGHLSVSLLVVGLAPGRLGAERTGIPFCGDRSGAMLDTLLARAGLSRAEVFVTNAVLCNPQDERGRNAPPAATELSRCRDHLRATVELVSAPVVVALGRTAFTAVVATFPPASLHFEDCLGEPQPWAGRRLAATFHCGPRVTASAERRAALLAQWDALSVHLARGAEAVRC
jgi:uracil-DNA glycosylase